MRAIAASYSAQAYPGERIVRYFLQRRALRLLPIERCLKCFPFLAAQLGYVRVQYIHGIVVGIAAAGHAAQEAVVRQAGDVGAAGILHAAIGVMAQARQRRAG
jgi:hypothetical protein